MLDLQNVSSGYDKPILHNISFRINRGECIAVLGQNGSGKTTLIKTLVRTCKQLNGKISIVGKNAKQLTSKTLAQHVAVVPQSVTIPFGFSVYEFVSFGRFPHLKPLANLKQKDRMIIDTVLEMIGIEKLSSRDVRTLSAGEMQRVIIAQSLAQMPRILLLDEPIAHLDMRYQHEILDMLTTLNRKGLTILAIMHDINLTNTYFKRIIFMKSGRVLHDGKPEEVCTETNLHVVYDMPCAITKTNDGMIVVSKKKRQ